MVASDARDRRLGVAGPMSPDVSVAVAKRDRLSATFWPRLLRRPTHELGLWPSSPRRIRGPLEWVLDAGKSDAPAVDMATRSFTLGAVGALHGARSSIRARPPMLVDASHR